MPPTVIPSITVIVPHHNRPGLLRQALLSIHNQTVKPSQIIVVDDCSNLEARRELDQLSDLATIVNTPKNLGLSGARNFGANLATGEWLAFLDDDDLYLPHRIEKQLQYLRDHPECVALGGGMTMKSPDRPEEYWGGTHTGRISLSSALFYTASMAQALLIRREAFLDLGGFDVRIRRGLEDYEFGIRIVASGMEMHFLAEPLFIYHLGGREQLSRNWTTMLWTDLRTLWWHRELCRREFGRLGFVRMVARSLRTRGERYGHFMGRSLWLIGRTSDAIIGGVHGQYY